MSGLTDMFGNIEDWAKSLPGALKQGGKDVAEYPGQATQAFGQLLSDAQQGYGKDVANPFFKFLGMAQPYSEDQPAADPAPSGDEIGGKKYKFTKETLDPSKVEDVTSSAFEGQQDPAFAETLDKGGKGFKNVDPGKLTDKEYDTLTREAAKGNKLAQGILVKGKYKEQGFPSLGQDLAKFEDPFVNALSGLPTLATSLEGQQQAAVKPYDFTNADSQVNSLLGQMGSSMRVSASPETQSYADKIAFATGGNELTQSTAGLPSIMQSLGQLGPAAKLSVKSTPDQALLGALLSHLQYEDIYNNAFPTGGSQPKWLESLMALATGQSASLGSVAGALPGASGATTGSLPGATPSPTGSNA